MKRIHLLFVFIFIVLSNSIYSQVIWSEDFESNNAGDQFLFTPGGKWYTEAGNCDSDLPPYLSNDNYWGVYNYGGNNVFRVEDMEGQSCWCADSAQGKSDNYWYSEIIDVSGYPLISITVWFEVTGTSAMECIGCGADSLKVSYMAYYSGSGWDPSWNDVTVFCGADVGVSDTSCMMVANADSLKIRIMAGNQANGEEYIFDDIIVSAGSLASCCPDSLIELAAGPPETVWIEDFASEGLGTWTSYSVDGAQVWAYNTTSGAANMNGYDGGFNKNEDWLISPAINFDLYTNPSFNFDNSCNFTGADIELFVSTDYPGTGDPSASTWSQLTGWTLSPGGWTQVNSGDIDLSSYSGTGYLAVVYTSAPNNGKSWDVDNMELKAQGDGITNVTCEGGSDGAIYLNSINGVEPYEFAWSNGATTKDLSGVAAGVYYVTVTDAINCIDIDTFNIADGSPLPVLELGADQNICNGSSVTLDAGVIATSYLWSTAETTQSIDVSSDADYYVTITDAIGCTNSDMVHVNVHSPMVNLADQDACSGSTIDAGSGMDTYAWSTGETTQTIIADTDGEYSVTITDAYGCTDRDTMTFTIHTPQILLNDKDTCAGQSVTLDAGNGFSGYQWNTGATTQSLSVSLSGEYSVTVTDSYGCTDRDTALVTIINNPIVDLGAAQSICFGTSLILDAGTDGSAFIWNTTETTQTIDVTSAGTYFVTVSNASGCSTTDNVTITVSNPMADLGENQVTCTGATVILNPGTFTMYSWSTGETTQTIDVTTTNVYSVTVTDTYGCTDRDSISVTFDSFLEADLGPDMNVCDGETVTLNAGSFDTYTWSNSATTQSIQVTSSGTYSVTVVSGACPPDSDTIQVTFNSLPVVNLGGNQAACDGETVALDAGPGYTYLWSEGSTSQTINTTVSGTFTVTITDGNNCEGSDQSIVVINANPTIDLGTDLDACNGTTITLDAGISASYFWNTAETSQSIDVTSGGDYSVTITNAFSCTAFDSITVTYHQPAIELGANLEFCDGDNGSVDAGGGFAAYSWNTTETTQAISVTAEGTYSVTVTDSYGCTIDDFLYVTFHNPQVLLSDTDTCEGQSLAINAGSGFASYAWSTGETSQSISVNSTGLYIVTVTDANSCTDSDTSSVTIIPNPVVELGPDQIICIDQTVTLNAGSDGTNYLWNTAETTQTINISSEAAYFVTVTNASGCSSTDNINVSHSIPVVNLGGDQTTCTGTTVTLDAGAFDEFLWSTSETGQTIDVTVSGNYSVTATNSYGCTDADTITVSFDNFLSVDLGEDIIVCEGDPVTINAGSFDSYTWNNSATTQSINVTSSGIYSVTVTSGVCPPDADSVEVTFNSLPIADLGGNHSGCQGEILQLDAGPGMTEYLWSEGSNTQTIDVSSSGTYSVTITDANGCSDSDQSILVINSNPIVNLGGNQDACSGDVLTLDAGTSGSSFFWNTLATTQSIDVTSDGTYAVTVTNAFACTSTDEVTITYHNPATYLGNDQTYCSGNIITLDAGPGFSGYNWSNGATTQTIDVSTTNIYYVTVTDAFGCTASDNVTISFDTAPVVALGEDQESCEGDSISLDAGIFESYIWNTTETTQSISVTTTGYYAVTVTLGSCPPAYDSVFINFNPIPVILLTDTLTGCSGDMITLDAGSGFDSYLWNTLATTQTIDASSSGTYSVEVSKDGCTNLDTTIVVLYSIPTVDIGNDTSICPNNNITLDPGSFLSYLWNDGSSAQGLTVSGPGNYSVTVTDENGCVGSDAIVISQGTVPDATIIDPGSFCMNSTEVILYAAVTGGTWSGTGITDTTIGTFNPATAGIGYHDIIYTLSTGCGNADTIILNVYDVPAITESTVTDVLCFGNSDGAISIQTYGQIPLNYFWSSGSTDENPELLGEGTYTVTITDGNGCTLTSSFSVEAPEDLNVQYTVVDETCADRMDGSIVLNVTGGTPKYHYDWADGSESDSLEGLVAGQYNVTVSDINLCEVTASIEVITIGIDCYGAPEWFVPTAFSPNDDNENDILYVRGEGIIDVEFIVFDRWGQKVFETTTLDKGWDGSFKGKKLDAAVFVWKLYITFYDGSEVSEEGTVTIVR